MRNIRNFFVRNFFGRNLPFNYRIYMIFFFECLLISVVSATTNTLLHKGTFGIIFQWGFIFFCVLVLFIPIQTRMAIVKPLLLFVSFLYIPFLFFQTAGYEGTAGLFALLAVFLIAIVFSGKTRVCLVASNLVLLAIACILQYKYPHIVVPHESEQANFLDYMVALLLAVSGIAILGAYIKNTFEEEQTRIRNLLKKEERANKKLENLTNRDPLTNTYNRRFLIRFLESERGKEERLCVMMMDIDYFKHVNDTWGHGFGDEVLVRFASTVQGNLRKDDILARTGGEEFVVTLKDITLSKAEEIAERIRQSVSEIAFSNGAQITVSIGLVQAGADEEIDLILNRADKCLYEAKTAGRNRVVYEPLIIA
ncbi:GGDEF domain-containing protein [Ruminococcaceae bacterium OttesenSCG-928-I18]|nr:GGDEF domain-containing protein [Ruminococcaceae bacterium OttesenSCG-928-I18]